MLIEYLACVESGFRHGIFELPPVLGVDITPQFERIRMGELRRVFLRVDVEVPPGWPVTYQGLLKAASVSR